MHRIASKQGLHHQTGKFLVILSIFGTACIFFSLFAIKPPQIIPQYPSFYISFSLFINILNLVGLFSLWRWKTWGMYFLLITSGINMVMDYIIFHNQPLVLIAMIITWTALLMWYKGIYKKTYAP